MVSAACAALPPCARSPSALMCTCVLGSHQAPLDEKALVGSSGDGEVEGGGLGTLVEGHVGVTARRARRARRQIRRVAWWRVVVPAVGEARQESVLADEVAAIVVFVAIEIAPDETVVRSRVDVRVMGEAPADEVIAEIVIPRISNVK